MDKENYFDPAVKLLLSDKKPDCLALYRLLVHSEESGKTESPEQTRRRAKKSRKPFDPIDAVRLLPSLWSGLMNRFRPRLPDGLAFRACRVTES
jgi:hypothetical protein